MSPGIEKPHMKFTATLIASGEQSLESIFFSSHLSAASEKSDMEARRNEWAAMLLP